MSHSERTQARLALEPIAIVKNDVKEIGRHDWEKIVSELIVRPDLEDALDSLEKFSHLVVIFWMHLSPPGENAPHKTHPQKRTDLPLVGVFATRSPIRPNPLGVTIVKLLEKSGNVLKVIGLDAINGTPVVDIKPYLPGDSVSKIEVPDWVHKLHQSTPK